MDVVPTFFRAALDDLAAHLGRTFQALPGGFSTAIPSITVVQARACFEREILIQDAVALAVVRAEQPLPGMLQGSVWPEDLAQTVERMVSQPGAPRVLVLPNLMTVPQERRQEVFARLAHLEDAPSVCHIITTADPSWVMDHNEGWRGRITTLKVDLSPRADLAHVLSARGSLSPGRSPLIRELALRQWQQQWSRVGHVDRPSDGVFAQALAEFAADRLEQEAWPWPDGDDAPLLLLTQASALLPAHRLTTMVDGLVQRLANSPRLLDHRIEVDGAPRVYDLDSATLERLRTAFRAPAIRWSSLQREQACEALIRPRPVPAVIDVPPSAVVDERLDLDPRTLDVVDLDVPSRSPDSWWRRWWFALWGIPASPYSRPLDVLRRPDHAVTSMPDSMAWNALEPLLALAGRPELREAWLGVSVGMARRTMAWAPDDQRRALSALIDGLETLAISLADQAPSAEPDDPHAPLEASTLHGLDSSLSEVNPRRNVRDRFALLSQCDALDGWTDVNRRALVEAIDPLLGVVYQPTLDFEATLQESMDPSSSHGVAMYQQQHHTGLGERSSVSQPQEVSPIVVDVGHRAPNQAEERGPSTALPHDPPTPQIPWSQI